MPLSTTARAGRYYDTHLHPVPAGLFDLLGHLPPLPVLLERDGHFPPDAELDREVAAVPRDRSARMAADQAALLDALLDGAPLPPGVDPDQAAAAAAAAVLEHRRAPRRRARRQIVPSAFRASTCSAE